MVALRYTKPGPIVLKGHPDFTEAWLQQKIKDDPSILQFGDVEVLEAEQRQGGGSGRSAAL